MKILTNVIIKQVLTESSRARLTERFETQKVRFLKESEQLKFELKRLEKKAGTGNVAYNRLVKEIESRVENSKMTDFNLEQLHLLPLGSEVKEGEIEAIAEVNVGDNWEEVSRQKVIVIKDGIVQEIR